MCVRVHTADIHGIFEVMIVRFCLKIKRWHGRAHTLCVPVEQLRKLHDGRIVEQIAHR
jgi:hypothetical protein